MKVTLPLVTLICLLQTSNAVDITAPRDLVRDKDNTARYLGGYEDEEHGSGKGGSGKGGSGSDGRIRKRQ